MIKMSFGEPGDHVNNVSVLSFAQLATQCYAEFELGHTIMPLRGN